MRNTIKTNAFKGSSLLSFNSQALWRQVFRETSPERNLINLSSPSGEPSALSSDNRLIHADAIYFSDPNEVRTCIEKLLPNRAFNLVLTNKAP